MPIPQSQLEIWSHQGAVTTSSSAYNSLREALLKQSSPLAGRGVDIFLQGSYANSTNIYGDSDVDVVVLCDQTFCCDIAALSIAAQQAERVSFVPATYQWCHLRDDTLSALRAHYGQRSVTVGPKSIKVMTGYGKRPSDVIPAIGFRRYVTFLSQNDFTAHWGMQFFDAANNPIVNYPKYHISRGEDKNQKPRTGGNYKATVRVFKNLRNYLIDSRFLNKDVAPSYFLECALHAVPDSLFLGDLRDTVPVIIAYLTNCVPAYALCQNGVVPLFGSGSTQWSQNALQTFARAAKFSWDNWYN